MKIEIRQSNYFFTWLLPPCLRPAGSPCTVASLTPDLSTSWSKETLQLIKRGFCRATLCPLLSLSLLSLTPHSPPLHCSRVARLPIERDLLDMFFLWVVCTGLKCFIGWKVRCGFCFEICTPEGRGRECKSQNKAHGTFDPRDNFTPVVPGNRYFLFANWFKFSGICADHQHRWFGGPKVLAKVLSEHTFLLPYSLY